MLPKSARLSRHEFSAVFTRPEKRAHFPEYSLYFSTSPTFKASVVAGKKVAKRAVDRNQLRRAVYGGLQTQLKSATHPTGHYIFILKAPFTKLSKVRRQEVIKGLLAQNQKSR